MPTGINCDFDNNGKQVTLALVNATYDVTVYAASSGTEVGQAWLNATTSECPYVAAYREGDTQYVMTLTATT
jgi:hypothetical protein